MTGLLPLFPLELVLFPGAPLPMHIFEPRYKEMIGLCLEHKTPFGVVLARSDGICRIGCTAEIVKLVNSYPDGKMDILTTGRNRFAVEEPNDELDYLRASVTILPDEAGGVRSDRAVLVKFYEQCYFLLHGHPPGLLETSSFAITYQIASELPLDLEFKQTLLETLSEAERHQTLLARLTEWLPQLEQRDRVRRKAGGNGHAG